MEKGIFKDSLSLCKTLFISMFTNSKVALVIIILSLFLLAKHTFAYPINLTNLSFKLFASSVLTFILSFLFYLLIVRALLDMICGKAIFYNFDLSCIKEAVKRFFIIFFFSFIVGMFIGIISLPLQLLFTNHQFSPILGIIAVIINLIAIIIITLISITGLSFYLTGSIKHHYSLYRWAKLIYKNKLKSFYCLIVSSIFTMATGVLILIIKSLTSYSDLNQIFTLEPKEFGMTITKHLLFPDSIYLDILYGIGVYFFSTIPFIVLIKKLLDNQEDGWKEKNIQANTE